jgi:hypothetical protein
MASQATLHLLGWSSLVYHASGLAQLLLYYYPTSNPPPGCGLLVGSKNNPNLIVSTYLLSCLLIFSLVQFRCTLGTKDYGLWALGLDYGLCVSSKDVLKLEISRRAIIS